MSDIGILCLFWGSRENSAALFILQHHPLTLASLEKEENQYIRCPEKPPRIKLCSVSHLAKQRLSQYHSVGRAFFVPNHTL